MILVYFFHSILRSLGSARSPASWQMLGIEEFHRNHPTIRGQSITVGIIDTGVDGNHPLLRRKVTRFFNARSGKEEPNAIDFSGHGTHIAGLIAGDQGLGIAPESSLIVAAGAAGTGKKAIPEILASLKWMIRQKPRIINNSWSLSPGTDPTPFYQSIEDAEIAGILMVFSAGNTGPRVGTITSPHEHPFAFSVGALSDNETAWSKTSVGPANYLGREIQKPEVSAPGEEIRSTFPHRRMGNNSGTSEAAGFVTAIAALLFQMHPNWTPAQMRAHFISIASHSDYWDPATGFGLVRLKE